MVTALVRYSLRALSVQQDLPSAVLHALNDILLAQGTDRFCTVVLVRLRLDEDGWLATFASGGHPLPLHVSATGAVRPVGADRLADRACCRPSPPQDSEVRLAPGDVLVMYTDGVTEGRHGAEFYGDERLLAAVRTHRETARPAERDPRRRPGLPARHRPRRHRGGRGPGPAATVRPTAVVHHRPPERSDPVNDSRAGTVAQPSDLVDVAAPRHRLLHRRARPADPDQRVAFGTSGHRGSQPGHRVQRGPHRRHHARRSASTAREQGYDGPLFLGRDTHGLSEPAWAVRARGARRQRRRPCSSTTATATPRPRRSRTRSCAPTAGRTGRARRRHRRHPVAQPARATAASSTTRRTAARPTPTPPRWIADRANELHRGGPRAACGGCRSRGPGPRRRVVRLPRAPTSTTCRTSRPRRDPGGRACASAPTRSAARRVDYWGAIAERHGLDLTVVNPLVDPTWRFMTLDWDGKIRMDCSSPYAMASLIAQQGRVRHRHRQRRRRRPARHRHPGRRPDEPQPLPRRRDRLPLRRRAARLAGATRRSARRWCRRSMIDRVAGDARPHAGRGAGRVQVVRARAARRVGRLRRRGVRRARRSCAATARCGPPTRTASCWRCSPRRSWPSTGQVAERALRAS